jgi:hypothetical protein
VLRTLLVHSQAQSSNDLVFSIHKYTSALSQKLQPGSCSAACNCWRSNTLLMWSDGLKAQKDRSTSWPQADLAATCVHHEVILTRQPRTSSLARRCIFRAVKRVQQRKQCITWDAKACSMAMLSLSDHSCTIASVATVQVWNAVRRVHLHAALRTALRIALRTA